MAVVYWTTSPGVSGVLEMVGELLELEVQSSSLVMTVEKETAFELDIVYELTTFVAFSASSVSVCVSLLFLCVDGETADGECVRLTMLCGELVCGCVADEMRSGV